ncbi:hypothetical protein D6D12_09871 [Aureobasidium pullulans]|uniref:Uncharacterized protein n=1 Tax=Aureobasidium pullulans TaxID=5580 RepID=A0A4S9ETX7_AURPU|nr:hypothetical protein D6D12_09871 [Aureobasidium pullulans]THX38281.1 hypothetical protein D6D11_09076 [Aureobasidium pullulans]THX72561.1 hypothetical protein D6D04_09020 [Aureobasidium pullulans]THX90200.1 hypothetical protein D6D08_03630 [Aureobasidium pullulans]
MSSYFDVLSWTRARKNREALEKTNPQNPVLNDDDEQFLERITSQEAAVPPLPTIEPTVIDDEGNETEATATQKEAAEMILPSSPGESKEKRTWASYIPKVPNVAVPSVPAMPSLASLRGSKAGTKADEKEAVKLEDSDAKVEGTTELKASNEDSTPDATQDDKSDLTDKADETVEAAKDTAEETAEVVKETAEETAESTKKTAEQTADAVDDTKDSTTTSTPVINQEVEEPAKDDMNSKTDPELKEKASENVSESKEQPEEGDATNKETTGETEVGKTEEPAQRTWASYIPAMPAIPSIGRNSKGKEAEELAKEQTPEAKEQNEREVSVLLDRLNLSAINNRVFSFSDQSQKIYGEFTLILKDIVNGAPTAWEDLEGFIKENEKHLEGMFKNMPPFVQTLVKSLPAKFASSMGPEIMAMAGDKPGNDLKQRMDAASKASSSASAGVQNLNLDVKKKQKRKVPGLKDLASQKGTVTSMLTNIVNFLKVRFPAFVTGTNVVMSLAVFILLFVFWYCHKRGKEVRMLRDAESTKASANISEVSDSDSSEDEKEADTTTTPESDTEEEKIAAAKAYAAGMQKSSVGGPDNAAALRAKKILEQDKSAEKA